MNCRDNILILLADGRKWTARELADYTGYEPSAVHSHLGRLTLAKDVVRTGRRGMGYRFHLRQETAC